MDFIEAIRSDMKPALGVTEPAAIALACAKARSLSAEAPLRVSVLVNSGIYKNAYTCGIPNTSVVGNDYAAALGCWFGDAERGLMVLDSIGGDAVAFCAERIAEGSVEVDMEGVTSDIAIKATVTTEHDVCEAHILHAHTNICFLKRNGEVLLDERKPQTESADAYAGLESVTLEEMFDFVTNASAGELGFIREAYALNGRLMREALDNPRCVFARKLLEANGGEVISDDAEKTALLMAGAAAEARVLGLNCPAMSITGSGNHGIIASMPLYGCEQVEKHGEEALLRATALTYLITMYIKHYSGILSALCGCAVAAGTGMACGLTFLRGGDLTAVKNTLYNMTNSIVGMICQGGNHGCVMKLVSAVKTAFSASELGMAGAAIEACHGIGDYTPEQTMRNIGLIAVPGMVRTEETIVGIFRDKDSRKQSE
ncbi:MAG: serine dehydratase subunit alpha family protein [Clostridia bacterium]|nr:serine dehydratase subunit alpha family protein [Clostridia bacterium]